MTEIGEIPVMTSFTLQQLSLTRLLTFTSEMKWQPQPAAHVLSGLIRSEAFNANLLWTFHLYHSLCPEYNLSPIISFAFVLYCHCQAYWRR